MDANTYPKINQNYKLGVFAAWNSPKAIYSNERWAEDKRFYLEPVDITTPKERGQ